MMASRQGCGAAAWGGGGEQPRTAARRVALGHVALGPRALEARRGASARRGEPALLTTRLST